MKKEHGLYDLLRTERLLQELRESGQEGEAEWSNGSDNRLAPFLQQLQNNIAVYVADFLHRHIEKLDGKKELVPEICKLLQSGKFAESLAQEASAVDGRRLLSLYPPHERFGVHERPDTPLYASSLLTGSSRTPSLVTQIAKELSTCDHADWLVSFIKMSGIGPLREALERFTATPAADGGPRLRIATTSYMGATDAAAIDFLRQLPNTEVRISYDTKRTRLHAKAYIFHRATGFGSAYIGSANISKAAMDQGLEWTVKVSQHENPHLWADAIGTFESHWADITEFTVCATTEHISQLCEALDAERNFGHEAVEQMAFFNIRPYTFQERILESIENERRGGKNRHLVVAATGTGKTMIAAFDFQRYLRKHPGAKLLFLVHREEILKQARKAFRQVLRDGNFGDIVMGGCKPGDNRHWFCTIQSWHGKYQSQFPADYFDYVVMDEAHHAGARTYREVLAYLRPQSLLALTATPERGDGVNVVEDFGGSYTHEIRLQEAIAQELICPFHYYGVPDHESVDFSKTSWNAGRYKTADLDNELADKPERAGHVLAQVQRYVADIRRIRAIGFCVSIRHARFMADFCNAAGIKAVALTSESPQPERESAPRLLREGKLQIIFTVDLYNEGVDIVDVDTVLFLRPTESLTVFLQQLGRGLRKADDKSHLDVFDFIARQNENYDYEGRFNAMSCSIRSVEAQLRNGFTCMPPGCFIYLERQAQETVLHHISKSLAKLNSKQLITRIADLLRKKGARRLTLVELMQAFNATSPERFYKAAMPCVLYRKALNEPAHDLEEFDLAKGCLRFLYQTDAHFLRRAMAALGEPLAGNEMELSMFYSVIFGVKKPGDGSLSATHAYIRQRPDLVRDLQELLQWQETHQGLYGDTRFPQSGPLVLHASYTRDQILLALGSSSYEKPANSREGVFVHRERKLHVFFADINKSEKDFSETTRYDDYAMTEDLFHWQSQSTTTESGMVGQSYLHHKEQGYTILLFIRKHKTTASGTTAPYIFLGPIEFDKNKGCWHRGSKPMNIVWHLLHRMPAEVYQWASKVD